MSEPTRATRLEVQLLAAVETAVTENAKLREALDWALREIRVLYNNGPMPDGVAELFDDAALLANTPAEPQEPTP